MTTLDEPLPGGVTELPSLAAILDSATVVRVPMRVRFRGVDAREAVVFEGPHGWGEFAPFGEYSDVEAAAWLASAIDSAWCPEVPVRRDRVRVNATVPAVPAGRVPEVLARFDGCGTVKVKVAEPGQSLEEDLSRVRAVREVLGPGGAIRVDANGAWTVDAATEALTALAGLGLEYAEQPCATVPELVELRGRLRGAGVPVPIAADESIRKAEDPLLVARSGAADIAVVKVAPLGGVRRVLALADQLAGHGVRLVVSSAIDTSVGLAAGVRAAAALPEEPPACGLGTAALLRDDVLGDPLRPVDGVVAVRAIRPETAALHRLRVGGERAQWWRQRLGRCHRLLVRQGEQR